MKKEHERAIEAANETLDRAEEALEEALGQAEDDGDRKRLAELEPLQADIDDAEDTVERLGQAYEALADAEADLEEARAEVARSTEATREAKSEMDEALRDVTRKLAAARVK